MCKAFLTKPCTVLHDAEYVFEFVVWLRAHARISLMQTGMPRLDSEYGVVAQGPFANYHVPIHIRPGCVNNCSILRAPQQ